MQCPVGRVGHGEAARLGVICSRLHDFSGSDYCRNAMPSWAKHKNELVSSTIAEMQRSKDVGRPTPPGRTARNCFPANFAANSLDAGLTLGPVQNPTNPWADSAHRTAQCFLASELVANFAEVYPAATPTQRQSGPTCPFWAQSSRFQVRKSPSHKARI